MEETQVTYQEYLAAMDIVLKFQAQVVTKHLEIKDSQHSSKPISAFQFSARIEELFSTLNINTIGDILNYTEDEFRSFNNFGKISVREIKQVLTKLNLQLPKIKPTQL